MIRLVVNGVNIECDTAEEAAALLAKPPRKVRSDKGVPRGPHNRAENNDRERLVLAEREKGRTLESIGQDLGITKEGVRQIQERAFQRLPEEEKLRFAQIVSPPPPPPPDRRPKRAIKKLLIEHLAGASEIRYLDVMEAANIAPLYDGLAADLMPELATCRELYDRYGLRWFGKFIRCSRCDEILPAEKFSPAVREASRSSLTCKPCEAFRANENYHNNPKVREYGESYRREHPEVIKRAAAKYYAAHREKYAQYKRKWWASLSPEQKRAYNYRNEGAPGTEKRKESNRRKYERWKARQGIKGSIPIPDLVLPGNKNETD